MTPSPHRRTTHSATAQAGARPGMRRPQRLARAAVLLAAITGGSCAGHADDAAAPATSYGPNPVLPAPQSSFLPTMKIAKVVGWPQGATPTPADGLVVEAVARGLDHPRWLYVLPNGDILAALSKSPANNEASGLRGMIGSWLMSAAGAGGDSPDRIMLLRQTAAGVQVSVFLSGLHSPIGMALVGEDFYVANADSLWRYPYHAGDTAITAPGSKLCDLPGHGLNHHWTKSLIASPDGTKLYVGVGSNSNVGENGMAVEAERAAIWEIDRATGAHRVYASGLRNPVGLGFQPGTNTLWVSVNERDELGNDLVPDYMTSVQEGGFYGWPYSYYGQTLDARAPEQRPDLVARAIKPDYALGAHTASLGLAFASKGAMGPNFAEGVFIGQHGSWNRKPPSGYKVIFVAFRDGKPTGLPVDVLSGFLNQDGQAQGRPVGVALDPQGALLVADDVGGVVWRVHARTP